MDESLAKLYLPITSISTKSGENLYFELANNALAFGPNYELIVNESEGWHKLKDENILGVFINIINQDKIDNYEKNNEAFLKPFYDIMGERYYIDGEPHATKNIVRPIEAVLTMFQIGSEYQCTIGIDYELLRNAKMKISEILEKINDEELQQRIKAIDNILNAYHQEQIDGLLIEKSDDSINNFQKFFHSSISKELSSDKWMLGINEHDLFVIKENIKDKIKYINSLKEFDYLMLTSELFDLLIGTKFTGGILFAIDMIRKHYSKVDFNNYAPPMVNALYFSLFPHINGAVGSKQYGWEHTFYVRKG